MPICQKLVWLPSLPQKTNSCVSLVQLHKKIGQIHQKHFVYKLALDGCGIGVWEDEYEVQAVRTVGEVQFHWFGANRNWEEIHI